MQTDTWQAIFGLALCGVLIIPFIMVASILRRLALADGVDGEC